MSPKGVEVIVHQHELPLLSGEVVGEVEIAERLGVEVVTVAQWKHRAKGRAGVKGRAGFQPMPPPRWTVSGLPAWYWPDVEQWATATGRLAEARP